MAAMSCSDGDPGDTPNFPIWLGFLQRLRASVVRFCFSNSGNFWQFWQSLLMTLVWGWASADG